MHVHVICRYRKAISDAGLSSVVCVGDETFPVNDVSFVDDMAQPVVDVASTICQKIGKIANVAYAVFRMFGMLLNFPPGKSETTVSFRGTDSKKAAKILFLANYTIPIQAGEQTVLRVVRTYQHVGTLSPPDLNMAEEVARRNGMMRAESRNLCSKFMHIRSIPKVKKIHVMQAYIMSKGTFQCGTWPALSDAVYKKFHATILSVYRNATGTYFKFKKKGDGSSDDIEIDGDVEVNCMFNDDNVIYENNFVCPKTILRFSRLALLFRILRKSPPGLIDLVKLQARTKMKKGWIASVHDDCKWLALSAENADRHEYSLVQWIELFSSDPTKWFRSVRKFCKSPYANIVSRWADSPQLKVLSLIRLSVNCVVRLRCRIKRTLCICLGVIMLRVNIACMWMAMCAKFVL